MDRENEAVKPGRSKRGLLQQGESAIALIGVGLAAILLCAMGGAAWYAVHTQKEALREAQIQRAKAAGQLLASNAEIMLARGELSSLRKLVSDTARMHGLVCDLALPGDAILVSSEAGRTTVREMPAKWPEMAAVDKTALVDEASLNEDKLTLTYALQIPGQGMAKLQIDHQIEQPVGLVWEAQTGLGGIVAAALLALLLVYRHSRARLRAMGAIREALLAIEKGESTASALTVNESFGAEAEAWNQILAKTESMRKEMLQERAKESLGDRRKGGSSDLDNACDALPSGLLIVDTKMRPKYANGAAAALLQTERTKLMGSDLFQFIGNPEVSEMLASWTNEGSKRRVTLEASRGGDKETGILRWTIRPMRKDDSGAAMVTIEDITQQKIAEESRHQFVAHATHELRTPLTNIRLYIETALDEGEKDEALRAKCLNVINSESRRLDRLVNDMLSTAEIEAGSLQVHADDVRLKDVFTELATDYEMQAKEKNISLTFDLPPKLPVIQADNGMIVLALHNLVGNALKYTENGGTVTVVVHANENDITVDVMDTGFGIDEEDQVRVFDRFYRAQDKRLKGITGSGLGLALAREVVRMHGGDITVKSELNEGSTFTMTLPNEADAA